MFIEHTKPATTTKDIDCRFRELTNPKSRHHRLYTATREILIGACTAIRAGSKSSRQPYCVPDVACPSSIYGISFIASIYVNLRFKSILYDAAAGLQVSSRSLIIQRAGHYGSISVWGKTTPI
jgi:hypothetical protein